MGIQKPQEAMVVHDQEFFPLTSSDQVIMEDGSRLNAVINKFIVPAYTPEDYGKLLACSSGGLAWVDSLSELANAEEVEF